MLNLARASVPMTPAAVLAVPRHLWLATLGAAAVTREWAERDASATFRTLVSEGSSVESRALRMLRNRVETSLKRAGALARDARRGVKSSVETLAGVASTFVRTKMPTVRASVAVESAKARRKPAAKTSTREKAAGHGRKASPRSTAKSRARK